MEIRVLIATLLLVLVPAVLIGLLVA